MQTVDFKINSHGLGMQGALDATEKLGAESGLTDKEILRLRLLAEELFGMVRSIAGDVEADYQVVHEKKQFALQLNADAVLTREMKEQFRKAASSGNTESKGLVSKILKMIARAVFPEDPEMSMLAMDLMSTGSPDGYLVNGGMYSWSMTKYKQEVIEEISKGEQDEEHEEAWDELEKSIVANIADEIAVKVKDRHVEITIYKNF